MKRIIDKRELIGLSPNSKLISEYKENLILSNRELSISMGLILGDASLQTQNKGVSYRLKFEWSEKYLSYINHIHKTFDKWILSDPHLKIRTNKLGNEVRTYGFQTLSHPEFNKLAKLFIKDNKKVYNEGIISSKDFTDESLAYWIMDDGGKLDYRKKNFNKSLILNTQNFSENEVICMINELNNKFSLNSYLRFNRKLPIIVIPSDNYNQIYKLTYKYIKDIECMRYKLWL